MKIVFTPVSVIAGLIAGLIGQKIFERLWGLASDREPPDAQHRDIEYPKLVAALLIEGAIFRVVKGLVDHGMRVAFARSTGTWPGEEAPERE